MTQNYNRYSYAMNNPLVYIDQDGENPWLIIGAIIGFVYLKAAHDNTPKQNQGNPLKWKWNPLSWSKPEEVVLHFGSNTDGSGMYGGISAGKAGQPQPMVGYNRDQGAGMGYHHNGNSNMYYPGYDYNKPEKGVTAAIDNAYKEYHGKANFKDRLHQTWNSSLMRFFIADTYYINLSGALAYIGGGGADVGLAFVTRGQNAGSVYATTTLKGIMGGHLAVGANMGRAMYTGKVNDYSFEDSFLGYSSGLEFDAFIGFSASVSERDKHKNELIMYDMGYGPSIGGSYNIGSITYGKRIFNFW
jgi:hypothetical protein